MKKNVLEFQKLASNVRPVAGKGTEAKPGASIDIWSNSNLSVTFCR